jgi:hypothetical protein
MGEPSPTMAATRGRPKGRAANKTPYSEQVAVRFPLDMLAEIDEYNERVIQKIVPGASRSDAIRALVRRGLDAEDK